jgi:N-acetylglucosamine malate deacetylase 1
MVSKRMASHYLDHLPEVDVAFLLPHPGDCELLCGGTIAKLSAAGQKVAILDLTSGEAGSHTRMDQKLDEADLAATKLGVIWRGSMGFPDARLEDTIMSRMTVTGEVKRLRPKVLVAMHWEDRHPDSLAASLLVENAAYLAALPNLDNYLSAHTTERVVFASGSTEAAPSFVVDISDFFAKKVEALQCYSTLFPDSATALESMEREARRLGAMIGVRYGEGFVQRKPLRGDLR